MTKPRYAVVPKSVTAHCCFEASVVDTSKPEMTADGRPLGSFKCICECFNLENAERIAAALNARTADKPELFIQWKGTDLCADFWCACGVHRHIDAMFVYVIKCDACGALYRVPETVGLERIAAAGPGDCVHVTSPERGLTNDSEPV